MQILRGCDRSWEVSQPALKLLEFFRGFLQGAEGGVLKLKFETAQLPKSSATMKGLQSMSEKHARMWVRYWKETGFIKGI